MIVLMNILNLKWMSILIRYWYIYLVRDGLLPSLFFVTSCHFACHFLSLCLSLLVTSCHFLSLLVTYHLFFVTSCHFLSLVSLDIYTTFYISVTLYRNWEKTALFSWRWKDFSALFDLLVQCVARIKFLVFNNLKVAEKAAT